MCMVQRPTVEQKRKTGLDYKLDWMVTGAQTTVIHHYTITWYIHLESFLRSASLNLASWLMANGWWTVIDKWYYRCTDDGCSCLHAGFFLLNHVSGIKTWPLLTCVVQIWNMVRFSFLILSLYGSSYIIIQYGVVHCCWLLVPWERISNTRTGCATGILSTTAGLV